MHTTASNGRILGKEVTDLLEDSIKQKLGLYALGLLKNNIILIGVF